MATDTENKTEPEGGVSAESAASPPVRGDVPEGELVPTGESAAAPLGVLRYVHAAFLVAGILTAYLSGKVLGVIWSNLADWPAAVRAVPQLVGYSEDRRESLTLAAGAVVGLLTMIQLYRKEGVRRWAHDVAGELAKVTWPNRETVMNGTLVVVVASAIATVYVAVLDRFWGFLTTLVYGT